MEMSKGQMETVSKSHPKSSPIQRDFVDWDDAHRRRDRLEQLVKRRGTVSISELSPGFCEQLPFAFEGVGPPECRDRAGDVFFVESP